MWRNLRAWWAHITAGVRVLRGAPSPADAAWYESLARDGAREVRTLHHAPGRTPEEWAHAVLAQGGRPVEPMDEPELYV